MARNTTRARSTRSARVGKALGKGRARRTASKRSNGRKGAYAINLLKSDHREVEALFSQFARAPSKARKLELARKICAMLRTHTTIEEEIFYPAFLEATADKALHHEAEIEHEGAKSLIEQIEAIGPDDEYYDAKITVLGEMVAHHVEEEERRGGMFAEARQSEMDLNAIGRRLEHRKRELEDGAKHAPSPP